MGKELVRANLEENERPNNISSLKGHMEGKIIHSSGRRQNKIW
jgi:hypothetical protein